MVRHGTRHHACPPTPRRRLRARRVSQTPQRARPEVGAAVPAWKKFVGWQMAKGRWSHSLLEIAAPTRYHADGCCRCSYRAALAIQLQRFRRRQARNHHAALPLAPSIQKPSKCPYTTRQAGRTVLEHPSLLLAKAQGGRNAQHVSNRVHAP